MLICLHHLFAADFQLHNHKSRVLLHTKGALLDSDLVTGEAIEVQ